MLQAVDISTCYTSNVNQETIATIPPPVNLTLDPLDPAISGIVNNLTATGATANGDVTFIYGFNDGPFSDDRICLGLQAGILDYNIFNTVTSDGAGMASYTFQIPSLPTELTVFFRAVDVSTCTASNLNADLIQ